ncbi:hypothetical protein FRC17_003522, partial [Serendipita sp. 399]
ATLATESRKLVSSITQIYAIRLAWSAYLNMNEEILSLPHLQQLEGGLLPHALPELCSSLSTATNLTHLKFRLEMTSFRFLLLLPNQTGLIKLESLTILLHAKRPMFDESVLLAIVDNLASASRLQTLGIVTRNARPPILHSRRLVGHIVRIHWGSLRKLKLPLFAVSKSEMLQLLCGLPRLTHLWIAVTENSRVWIPDTLGASQSLSRLRLYGAGAWLINYAKSLLLQATQRLSVVKACRPCFPRAREKVTWTSYWEYDEELQFAFRRDGIQGERPTMQEDNKNCRSAKRNGGNSGQKTLDGSEREVDINPF